MTTSMTSHVPLWLLLFLTLGFSSCRPEKHSIDSARVSAPAYLSTPTERRDYIISHYWKRGLSPQATQSEVDNLVLDFCGFLSGASTATIRPALIRSLEQCPDEQLPVLLASYRSILANPKSHLRDEDSYKIILHWLIRTTRLDPSLRAEVQQEYVRIETQQRGTQH